MKFKALLLLLFTSVSFLRAMELDPKAIAPASQNDPLRLDSRSYIFHLPGDLYKELLNIKTNGKHHPAVNFWLMKHKKKKGFAKDINYPKDTRIVSIDEKSKRIILYNRRTNEHFLWNMEERIAESLGECPFGNMIFESYSMPFSYENKCYFSKAITSGEIHCWDLVTNVQKKTYPGVDLIEIDSNTKRVIAQNWVIDQIILGELEAGDARTFEIPQGYQCAAFNDKTNTLIIGFENGMLEEWDLETQTLSKSFATNMCLHRLRLSQDYNTLYSFHPNATLQLWDIKKSEFKPVSQIKINAKFNEIMCGFDVDNQNNLLFFNTGNCIMIYDLGINECIEEIPLTSNIDSIFLFDNKHNYLYVNSGIYGTMQIFELYDSKMKTDIWNTMSIYKSVLFERAYEVWLANEKINEKNKNKLLSWKTFGFGAKERLDLTKEPLLYDAFCHLPQEMQEVMRKHIPIIEPEKKVSFSVRRF